MTSLIFPHLDVGVTIRGDAETAEYVKRYFCPFIDIEGAPHTEWIIEARELKFSRALPQSFSRQKTRAEIYPGKPAEIYGTPPVLTIQYQETSILRNRRLISIVSLNAAELQLQVFAAARSIMEYHYLKQGFVILHAAATAIGKHGWVIVGEKGAGKTTTLFQLLADGAAYLGNDRVFIGIAQGKPVIVPRPSRIRIGIGTIRGVAALGIRLPKKYLHYTEKDTVSRERSKEKIEITSPKDLLPFAIEKPTSLLSGAVFPNIRGTNQVTRLRNKDVATLLNPHILEDFPGIWLARILFGPLPQSHLDSSLRTAMSNLILYRVEGIRHQSLLRMLQGKSRPE